MSDKRKNWAAIGVMFLGLFFLSFVVSLFAQQQFSGGQAVTITGSLPAGSNTIGAVTQASGPWTENLTQVNSNAVQTGIGASSTGTQRVAVSNDSTIGLVAGTAQVGVTTPRTGCGATAFESGSPVGFAALAASTTTVTSTTTCALTFVITNTGSASFTYYLTDNAATPIPVIGSSGNPITILAGERDEYTFPSGAKFNAGIKLTASATTGAYYVFGVQ
jgi:hypothetical protein